MGTVQSKDGTMIAYEKQGTGPAVILVDGALCYRGFGPMPGLAELLAPNFRVYSYDRRGRGESGNMQPYALQREVEDIDALIQAAGGSAFVYGISSGGCLALEAAMKLGPKIKELAIYEAPYNSEKGAISEWEAYRKKLDELLSSGRNGDAAALFMQFVGTPTDMIEGMRQSPMWPMFEAVAPTLAYDAAAMGNEHTAPTRRAAGLNTPTLVMSGTVLPFMKETATELARAIPHARQLTLEGQPHDVDLKVLAPVLVDFFTERAPA